MKAQIASDLKTSLTRSDVGIHREVAKCVAILSNRLSAIKAVGSGVVLSAKSKIRNKTSEGGVGEGAGSSAGSRNVWGSSSRFFVD